MTENEALAYMLVSHLMLILAIGGIIFLFYKKGKTRKSKGMEGQGRKPMY